MIASLLNMMVNLFVHDGNRTLRPGCYEQNLFVLYTSFTLDYILKHYWQLRKIDFLIFLYLQLFYKVFFL